MTKIKYDSDNKNAVINNLNTCINNLTSINNLLYNNVTPTDFYYRNTFINMQSDLIRKKIV